MRRDPRESARMPVPLQQERNLILLADERRLDWIDLYEIAVELAKLRRRIHVSIVSPEDTEAAIRDWSQPTLTVSFGSLGSFVPRRGRVFRNVEIPKLEQYARLTEAGLATPKTARFLAGSDYDPAVWGEFVVLKPLPLRRTSKGADVHLIRTAKLNDMRLEHFPRSHAVRRMPVIIQTFIDTGPQPTSYRILTLFGETLHLMKMSLPVTRPSLTAPDEIIEQAKIASNLAAQNDPTAYLMEQELVNNSELVALGRRVHALFPKRPLLGCDIVIDKTSGVPYILEINAGGNTWHFSSPAAAQGRKLTPRTERIRQFGAWKVAARALARVTEEFAS
jgi:hypothetical protein